MKKIKGIFPTKYTLIRYVSQEILLMENACKIRDVQVNKMFLQITL
ncbi:MAG: hypothetical protein JETT_3339 [Candidatus Jettenia ecosi]|uniref:Uncharacterized protein n=1 Tax=Candidatus Jettenia ecosi TaxID=2494326 RepID=A0A533Q701_9BACT|nr:MAG: hypothetical protein JETT_3339 [Candidatus Jettenia ecosi]